MQELCYLKENKKNCVTYSFILQILTVDFQYSKYLHGAYYQLHTHNGGVIHAMSDSGGNVTFHNLPSGNYTLLQTTPPTGYQPHPHCWKIKVDYLGYIWIDGIEKNRLTVCNVLNSLDDSGNIQLTPVITQPTDVCIFNFKLRGKCVY